LRAPRIIDAGGDGEAPLTLSLGTNEVRLGLSPLPHDALTLDGGVARLLRGSAQHQTT
jgi:hypothetical protein